MQHRKLLEQVEQGTIEPIYLAHTKRLLQSDLWSVERGLDERGELEPGRIAELERERRRIKGAIETIA